MSIYRHLFSTTDYSYGLLVLISTVREDFEAVFSWTLKLTIAAFIIQEVSNTCFED